ncbi:2-C-methyl-D-erythritol 4-phosphate cytidylyltransferase [Chromobacterium violaceum]|uniref:2-C-methyl-D-erythritol 4-phosphate cytidylyltransferase n=1 Tax=Chromobacterium violaceum TaxID=536 RepID=A0A202BCW2_CHRVL|nr:2-C-methyl-D-erythritol 4-phosphate cytidylyltransferase [Chromobacterium violaceum]ATP27941.1 2-C-methyl-D-erythritol 4-phosphate cytidylyltransferase [Chromobacterium violaceum]ATP31852.1 2-C-methyl-D-erythritol 4-phosphate cytidylyltransferase [Chromobacterium violaceum]KJH67517.1 2-C-methyl-D-erythritol 4-phosphate cytidylyltransferase [Chromobacterium violaceum]KMN48482.1 2-C-methyl-D-erythritol 4-phosphate cytidylyltransferase [Chromobacterium violaceum]KMN85616.1 2-C-methyl-D-erythri
MARMIALVPAAGSGSRFGAPSPKQYLQLNGKPLMWHTLATLAAVPDVDEVAVVISPQDEWFDDFAWDLPKLSVHRVGGASRAQSVASGLAALACADDDWVLVHDAARCCLSVAAVERLIAALSGHAVGGLLALPVPDTVKRADIDGHVAATVPRNGLWLAQTPQMFRAGLLARALSSAAAEDITDEASAVERLGVKPLLVEGDAQNFKITYPRDLALARAILAARDEY